MLIGELIFSDFPELYEHYMYCIVYICSVFIGIYCLILVDERFLMKEVLLFEALLSLLVSLSVQVLRLTVFEHDGPAKKVKTKQYLVPHVLL